jgi:PAS domain S-box-containing protein
MIEPSGFPSESTPRRRANGELLRQKNYLDELFELAPDAVVLTTLRNPRILRVNRAFTLMFGYTSGEAVGNRLRDLIMPDGFEPTLSEDPDLLAGRKVEREAIRRRKDGTKFHAHITGKRLLLSDDEDAAYLIYRDISARTEAEALFSGEKHLLEIIAAGGALTTTLDALCHLAEDLDRGSLTSILLVDRKGKQLRRGAGPSLPQGYVNALSGARVGLGGGPCTAAALLGEPVISLDLAADERWSNEVRALMAAYGLHSCWSTPIMSSRGGVLGTFAVYPSEPVGPTPQQSSRIEQLARLASIAIERAQSVEALHESEQRHERAMLAAEAGFWDWDLPTDEFYVSPKLLEMTDFPAGSRFASRADFMTRAPFHPDDRTKYECAVNELFASGGTRLAMEMRSIHGGETRWTLLSGMCVRDPAGKILRWTGSATDVTARKRAEDALLLSEERYALAMEASEEGHFDWNVQTDEVFASDHLKQLLDLPAEADHRTRGELIAAHIPFHPGDREPFEEMTRNVLAGNALHHEFEYRLLRGQARELRWIQTRWKIFRDPAGVALRVIGVVRDITERKRVEQELRSRQEMLEVAQEAARGVAFEWRLDDDERGNRWSLEAIDRISAASRQGGHESLRKLVHREDWPNVQAAIKAARQTGVVDTEYRLLEPAGATRWQQAIGRMFFDPEGKPIRIVGLLVDVTDRRLAEDELLRVERQLRQAQRLEALGTLAGGIAHDFNNLLGAILGYGEMALRNVRAGSRLRRDIENIMIAGERGRLLVERILGFSRSGVGEQVAVHLEAVVRETLLLFTSKLPRHIVMKRYLRAGSAAVVGDPTQIHQVLMNLLMNAVQAMPSGGTLRVSLDRIHVQASRALTTGSIPAREYVVMEVSDSGTGIRAEIFEKIFDPFFTTKQVGVGSGLGLSLVHGIVTGLGGAIDVATTIGKGSVFKVYLPVANDVAVPSKPRRRLQRRTRPLARGRVMVIDDEDALVRLATETLVELGYSAVGFTSGAQAIEAFLADPEQFDAVVTDESMPGMSGSELIRKMRTLKPTVPILLVSGYLGTTVVERARQAGATEVLNKPLSARRLQMALQRVLPATSRPSTKAPGASKRSGPQRRVGRSKSAT